MSKEKLKIMQITLTIDEEVLADKKLTATQKLYLALSNTYRNISIDAVADMIGMDTKNLKRAVIGIASNCKSGSAQNEPQNEREDYSELFEQFGGLQKVKRLYPTWWQLDFDIRDCIATDTDEETFCRIVNWYDTIH